MSHIVVAVWRSVDLGGKKEARAARFRREHSLENSL